MKNAVLLINLGTPDSPQIKDVKIYLKEFLNDPYVIDLPFLQRFFLVNYVIIPSRVANSAKCYEKIWSKEGSPLLVHSIDLKRKLQTKLGSNFHVELAMRYRKPSIEEALRKIKELKVEKIIIMPLFPHFATATSSSIEEKVYKTAKSIGLKQQLTFVESFYNQDGFIDSFVHAAGKYNLTLYDHILFSFHGIPMRHIIKAREKKLPCYEKQCIETARLISNKLGLSENNFTVCFQSRLGKEQWLQPYFRDVIKKLAERNLKKLLVFCPSFVCDCLETTYEISIEYADLFKDYGGEQMQLVEGLNSNDVWVEGLKKIITSNLK